MRPRLVARRRSLTRRCRPQSTGRPSGGMHACHALIESVAQSARSARFAVDAVVRLHSGPGGAGGQNSCALGGDPACVIGPSPHIAPDTLHTRCGTGRVAMSGTRVHTQQRVAAILWLLAVWGGCSRSEGEPVHRWRTCKVPTCAAACGAAAPSGTCSAGRGFPPALAWGLSAARATQRAATCLCMCDSRNDWLAGIGARTHCD